MSYTDSDWRWLWTCSLRNGMCIRAKRGQVSPCPTALAPTFSSGTKIPSQIDDDWGQCLQFELFLDYDHERVGGARTTSDLKLARPRDEPGPWYMLLVKDRHSEKEWDGCRLIRSGQASGIWASCFPFLMTLSPELFCIVDVLMDPLKCFDLPPAMFKNPWGYF